MGAGVLFYLTFWVAGVLLALVVGSALFQGAVALANRTLGPVERAAPIGWDWDADEEDEDPVPPPTQAIPAPTLGRGMGILFLTALACAAVVLVFETELPRAFGLRRRTAERVGLVAVLAVGFLALAGTAAGSLPTTFRRAALAAVYFFLILAGIAAVAAGLLSALFG